MDSKLIEALKVIKEHCESVEFPFDIYLNGTCVDKCPIGEFCIKNFNCDFTPEDWDLSDLEKDGGE